LFVCGIGAGKHKPSTRPRRPKHTHRPKHKQTNGTTKKRCPKFPTLPLVGKVGDKKPLPTYQSRVDAAGNVEVYV
jgi:hypothetical protein